MFLFEGESPLFHCCVSLGWHPSLPLRCIPGVGILGVSRHAYCTSLSFSAGLLFHFLNSQPLISCNLLTSLTLFLYLFSSSYALHIFFPHLFSKFLWYHSYHLTFLHFPLFPVYSLPFSFASWEQGILSAELDHALQLRLSFLTRLPQLAFPHTGITSV